MTRHAHPLLRELGPGGDLRPASLCRLSHRLRAHPVGLVTLDRLVLDEVTIGPLGTHDGQTQNAVLLLKMAALKKENLATIR